MKMKLIYNLHHLVKRSETQFYYDILGSITTSSYY